jgi:hypothetical protein
MSSSNSQQSEPSSTSAHNESSSTSAHNESEPTSDDLRSDPFTIILDPPPCKHIGRSEEFLQWAPEHHTEFLQWWLQQSWTRRVIRDKPHNQPTNIINKLHWDSVHRKSSHWAGFWQAVQLQTGKPVLICQNCSTEVAHPNILSSRINTLVKHLKLAIYS